MTPIRAGVVLLVMCTMCLIVVALRAERVRLDARAEAHEGQIIETRRRIWNLQAELARLRAPQEVRRRALRVEPGLCRNLEISPLSDTDPRVASSR
ncbi:MAG TPA: hypothetical protein P5572_05170 [Phycisphaerae bacterium]|nr:hypothetical protein [Phycisphaerae bacterium]